MQLPMPALMRFARLYLIPDMVNPPLTEYSRTCLASFAALVCTLLLAHSLLPEIPTTLLCGPLAASTILLFMLPHSPQAQPWPVAGGYLVATLTGISVGSLMQAPLWAALIAVPLTAWLMNVLRCPHPPGAAAAVVFATTYSATWPSFGLSAALGGILIYPALLLGGALALNNTALRRPYPHCKAPSPKTVHQTDDPPPLARLGLQTADLYQALREVETFMDIAEDDLERIYVLASRHAFQRQIGLTCVDIMSRDVVSITPATPLDEAWRLLRRHKIKVLPVVNLEKRIVGVVTVADFLKRFDQDEPLVLHSRLRRWLGRVPKEKRFFPQTVDEIMTTPVRTVSARTPIVDLVSQLSDWGVHQLPIVDERQELCGMVTQTDLIAALYHRWILQIPTDGAH